MARTVETRQRSATSGQAASRATRMSSGAPAEPRKRRSATPEARRAAILDAALEEFTARGYEGARLDDVAKRAGVAKGTIYLYFADKEALFQDLVRSMVHPVLGTLEQMREVDIPARMLVEGMLNTFVREILGTRRKDIVRLIFTEGTRFPAIAEFYHREVIARVLAIMRPILRARRRTRRTCRTIRSRAFRSSSSRPGWSRSCGTRCSRNTSRSTCRR